MSEQRGLMLEASKECLDFLRAYALINDIQDIYIPIYPFKGMLNSLLDVDSSEWVSFLQNKLEVLGSKNYSLPALLGEFTRIFEYISMCVTFDLEIKGY